MKNDDLLGKVLDKKYKLVRLIGEGGMGTVYEAKHLQIKRRLAVKLLHPYHAASEKLTTRFQREAQAAASIGHENIVEMTDMGETPDGVPYLVMEYLDGQSVKDLLDKEGPLPANRAAYIMVQTLSALQAAHKAGIIHRDLKPENIYLIEKAGEADFVKLVDFGISKFRTLEAESVSGLTQAGSVLGTPHYMSPEQAVGAKEVSTQSDIYSMGVVLYQILTASLPFEAPNYNALIIKILIATPYDVASLNPDIPASMVEIVNIAMARRPEKRFKDCNAFRKRLLSLASSTEPSSISSGSPAPPSGSQGKQTTTSHEVKVTSTHSAIFVGLGQSDEYLNLDGGRQLKIYPLQDARKVIKALDDSSPDLIVASADIDLDGIIRRFPGFDTPVILIDINDTHRELAIHLWGQGNKKIPVRRAPLAHLDDEIDQLCSRTKKAWEFHEDIRNVGFYNTVKAEDRTVHVETEVTLGGKIEITTKIWADGTVSDKVVQVFEPPDEDILPLLKAAAEIQHKRAHDKAKQGKD
jgi:serine/threonine-protein kinase